MRLNNMKQDKSVKKAQRKNKPKTTTTTNGV
jgi:hypothetical protein